jgi:hypothetical protein
MPPSHCLQLRVLSLLWLFDIPLLVPDSQLQQGRFLFPICPPTPTPTVRIPIPHSCSTAHCTFYPVRLAPPPLHVHHSSTDTPPDTDLRHHRHFCCLTLAASPSYSSAPHVRPSSHFRLPLFTVHLARTAPPLCCKPPTPPHPL